MTSGEVEPAASAKRLEELAYMQGRRDADVDTKLLAHERRLNAVNGSIEKHAQNAAKLEKTIERTREALEAKIDSLIAAQSARAAVEDDRERRATRGFTKAQTLAIAVGVPVGFLAAILSPFIAHWVH